MFIKKNASQSSIGKRSLIFGVGINDADYIIEPDKTNRKNRCPYYVKWYSMMTRCYSPKFLSKNKTYDGCSVSSEWLRFSSFKSWMENQEWEGLALDKDIIRPKNSEYSEEYCCFVPQSLNNLLCGHDAGRGKHPQGVTLDKNRNKFVAKISIKGKTVNLGRFNNARKAERAYLKAKIRHIISYKKKDFEPKILKGLGLHMNSLKNKLSKLEIFHNEKI